MPVHFQHGGKYPKGINELRNRIRANGTHANIHAVTISHPMVAHTVDMHINLAYEPNSNFPPVNGSLYTVAFSNGNGTWHFTVGAIGVALPGVAFPGALTGTYASLGYPLGLPNITDGTLINAITAVSNYAGAGPVPAPVLDGMARLIIAVNEAIRFGVVESGVNNVLGNANNYHPPVATIHNWGGHFLGN